jgi:hypothetical protein
MNIQPEWFQWGPAVAILALVLIGAGGFLIWYFKRQGEREDKRDAFMEKLIGNAEEKNAEHIRAWKEMVAESIKAQQAGVAVMERLEKALADRCRQANEIHERTVQHLLELKQMAQKG